MNGREEPEEEESLRGLVVPFACLSLESFPEEAVVLERFFTSSGDSITNIN